MKRFDGKVVLVSGASSGLGQDCARRLLDEGARILALGRDSQKLATLYDSDPNAQWLSCDISNSLNCNAAVAACLEQFGQLDVLLNIAGAHRLHHTEQLSDEDWLDDLAINLNAPFFLSRAAIPHLLRQAGNIVNIGSLASSQGQAYSASYCAAKHGLIGLTRALAMEYLNQPLRVNAVCPGGMDTPQIQNFSFAEDMDFQLIMKSSTERGMMRVADVSATVAFVASEEARGVHGAVYAVDQGRTSG